MLGMAIDYFSNTLRRQPKTTRTLEEFRLVFSSDSSYQHSLGATSIYSNSMGYNTFMEPHNALNIPPYVVTFALQHQLPLRSWLSPFRFSSTTRVACWISILLFSLTEFQPRPPSIPHVLLFLAIKSHILFVVLSHDASVSVMLMKGQ